MTGSVSISHTGDVIIVSFAQTTPIDAARLVGLEVGRNAPEYVENIGLAVAAFADFIRPRLRGESQVSRAGLSISIVVDTEQDTVMEVERYLCSIITEHAKLSVTGGNLRGGRGRPTGEKLKGDVKHVYPGLTGSKDSAIDVD